MRGTHLVLLFLVALPMREKDACRTKKGKTVIELSPISGPRVPASSSNNNQYSSGTGLLSIVDGTDNQIVDSEVSKADTDTHITNHNTETDSKIPSALATLIILKSTKTEEAYFIKEGAEPDVFESNLIATRASSIIKTDEPEIEFYDSKSLGLLLSNEEEPESDDRITNVMEESEYYRGSSDVYGDLALIKLKKPIQVRDVEAPDWVIPNMIWIWKNMRRIQDGKTKYAMQNNNDRKDLVTFHIRHDATNRQEERNTPITEAKLINLESNTEGDAYFLQDTGLVYGIFRSYVIAARAGDIVEAPKPPFEYKDAISFRLQLSNQKVLGDKYRIVNVMLADEKFEDNGADEHNIALIKLKDPIKFSEKAWKPTLRFPANDVYLSLAEYKGNLRLEWRKADVERQKLIDSYDVIISCHLPNGETSTVTFHKEAADYECDDNKLSSSKCFSVVGAKVQWRVVAKMLEGGKPMESDKWTFEIVK